MYVLVRFNRKDDECNDISSMLSLVPALFLPSLSPVDDGIPFGTYICFYAVSIPYQTREYKSSHKIPQSACSVNFHGKEQLVSFIVSLDRLFIFLIFRTSVTSLAVNIHMAKRKPLFYNCSIFDNFSKMYCVSLCGMLCFYHQLSI